MAVWTLKCSIAEPPVEFAEVDWAYARNLIAANRFHLARNSKDPEAREPPPWLAAHVKRWAEQHPGSPGSWEELLQAIRAEAQGRTVVAGFSRGGIGRNIRALGRMLRLTRAEQVTLQFKMMLLLLPGFWEMLAWYGEMPTEGTVSIIAAMTGEPVRAVARALDDMGNLVLTGMLTVPAGRHLVGDKLFIPRDLTDLLTGPRLTWARFADRWMPTSPPPSLTTSDYAHMGETVPRLKRILLGALEEREPGVNILLHGPTGTGKTELARLLAREVGTDLRMAGMRGRGGDDGATDRVASLVAGQRCMGTARAVILFDEMEDLFERGKEPHRSQHRMSKAYLTTILETNPVPVIWATNDVASMDPAIVRRFVAAVEVPPMGEAQRRVVWARQAAGRIPDAAMDVLARRFPVSPGTIAEVVRGARLAGAGQVAMADVEALLAGSADALGIVAAAESPSVLRYDVSLLRASVDLDGLAARLLAAGSRASATLCLHGPSGTGKSEWVRQLASRMRRPLHVHRVSDIESMWVGQAEKNVARAFEQAEREEAVLLFDEADSFLQNRSTAQRRWERTLTNEFLQRLEVARGIVACTTNTFESLDPAVMRRFSVKIEFGYLAGDAATRLFLLAFESHVGVLGEEAQTRIRIGIDSLPPLAPGDFAAVARRLPLLPANPTVDDLLAELRAEAAARSGGLRGAVGFRG